MNARMSVRKEELRSWKMKSVSFHSLWDVPKDERGRAKQEKDGALSIDCLLSVLVYDAHGQRKHYSTLRLELRNRNGTGE
ncbi:hypothetical protein NPIL_499021 [Nephila pilipes]|uniref:Uncharacterized protein n=1 Tax=Nephila pilipes TaxID=299642 RepID=A0A8X6R879_NEPPI|nr:hypothetical protein NPIL_499021 [Nephila pilipes]